MSESAQKNQKKIESAQNNPETSGPAENLREETAMRTKIHGSRHRLDIPNQIDSRLLDST